MRALLLAAAILGSLVATAAVGTAEIFTAMADMELLLGAEKQVTTVIDQYIEAEQRRLQRLKEYVIYSALIRWIS